MTTNILWFQPEKLSESNPVFSNGKPITERSEREEILNRLMEVADKVSKRKRPWCGKVKGYFFVKGSFKETDERGRMLSFDFLSDNKNGEKALQQNLYIVKKSLNTKTEEIIKEYQKKTKKIKELIIGSLIFCLLIAIVLITTCT